MKLLRFRSGGIRCVCRRVCTELVVCGFARLVASRMVIRGLGAGCMCGTGFAITMRLYERLFLKGVSPPGLRTLVQGGISPVQPNEDEPQGLAAGCTIDFLCEMTWFLSFMRCFFTSFLVNFFIVCVFAWGRAWGFFRPWIYFVSFFYPAHGVLAW